MQKRLMVAMAGWLLALPVAAQNQQMPPAPATPPATAPQEDKTPAEPAKATTQAQTEAPLPAVPLPARKGEAKVPSPVLNAKRVPLEQWRPEQCPKPTKPGEIVVCGRPEEAAPPPPPAPVVPGDRDDVVSEREALVAPVRTGDGSCSAVGPNGGMGCGQKAARQWKRAKKADEAQKAAEQVKIEEKKTP